MMGFGPRYDSGYPSTPIGRGYDHGGYDPRPPYGYDPRFNDSYPPMGGGPPPARGARQNQMLSPENQKKAAKSGAKAGKFLAKFGIGKLTENVDMGGFEDVANDLGERAVDGVGDRIVDHIDQADFGEMDFGRGPPQGMSGSRHVSDVMERRARGLSPQRGPMGYRNYPDRERDREPYHLSRGVPDRGPRDYDRRPPNEYLREPMGSPIMVRSPRDYDGGPPEDFSRERGRLLNRRDYDHGPRDVDPRDFDHVHDFSHGSPVTRGPRLTGPHDHLDDDSRFGDVAYKDIPEDVRKAYEKKLRESSPDGQDERQDERQNGRQYERKEGIQRTSRRGPDEDDRTYFMYPQGFKIQPGKFSSPPPSYKASVQDAPAHYGANHSYPDSGPAPWDRDRPAHHLGHYRSY